MIGAGARPITWEKLKEHFYEKYFSANLRHLKETEFLVLEQGNMFVEKYDQEFEQLSRFAPNMIATEAKRTKLSVQRLRDGLQDLE